MQRERERRIPRRRGRGNSCRANHRSEAARTHHSPPHTSTGKVPGRRRMALAACFFIPTSSSSVQNPSLPLRLTGASAASPSRQLRLSVSTTAASPFSSSAHAPLPLSGNSRDLRAIVVPSATGGGGGGSGSHGSSGAGGGGGGDHDGGADSAGDRNRKEALMVLAEADRSLKTLPKDLAAAIQAGRIPGSVVSRFLELEKSPLLRWLLQFGGFKERLLADDLFLAKVAMECGVGVFTKTAAEYERRRENFFNELEIVFADVVMAIIADFMLVYLPAPTVSLRPALAKNAGSIARFFHNCPDNAFQTALSGTSYSLLQRFGAIARNGAKLFAVGTTSSLVGTAMTNAFINARKVVDKSSADEVENVPILSTSAAYGVYMAVSSNLRYQVVAGVIEQRMLEPLLHQHKLMLSAMCFAVRTGNTFLGSLLWVDYARWIGIQ